MFDWQKSEIILVSRQLKNNGENMKTRFNSKNLSIDKRNLLLVIELIICKT